MTTRELFTDDEWQEASALPGLVVMAATLSDGKVMPSIREIKAGSRALVAGAARYPDNLVLQQLRDGAEAAKAESKEAADAARPADVADALEAIVGQIEHGVAVVRANVDTEEFRQVREVLIEAATAVVERIGDGFMGGGEKVDDGERAFVDRLTAILA